MEKDFRWNPYADQPHNVASRKERMKHHLRYAPGYLRMVGLNIQRSLPVLACYRRYRKSMFKRPVWVADPFGVAVSPAGEREGRVIEELKALGVRKTLVRIPSWEAENLEAYGTFLDRLKAEGLDVVLALLQSRRDVRNPRAWAAFLERVFSRFSGVSSGFEVGHAWNRTKWGVWDYREYLRLAAAAVEPARRAGARILGPAVIDFEFHLYPPVLRDVAFDVVTSLLYVDRKGAPENRQFGWDLPRKLALLRAVVDVCASPGKALWVTEVNWPLAGTGRYSPAAGRVNVSEEEQAAYLVRYYILCAATGFVGRIYWWQLAAPGYGLMDTRGKQWRRRPAFFAMKNLVRHLKNSRFLLRRPHPEAYVFEFESGKKRVAVGWTRQGKVPCTFEYPVHRVIGCGGETIPFEGNRVWLSPSPRYVHFRPELE